MKIFPARWPLAVASAILALGALAGGAHATPRPNGPSGPHLRGSCSGTTLTIASPARRIRSIAVFKAEGGTVSRLGLRFAARLSHPTYWVLPQHAVLLDTCGGMSVDSVEIGKNPRKHTELEAISVTPLGQSRQPTLVGQLLIPLGHGCAFRRVSGPVTSPDGRPVALFRPVPAGFDRSVSVLFTPCGTPKRRARSSIPPADRISFQIESEVRYSGRAGNVIVLVAKPSEAALRPGLNLGNPAGTLPNGTRLFALPGDVRWLRHDHIISVSGNVPIETLERLAAKVVMS